MNASFTGENEMKLHGGTYVLMNAKMSDAKTTYWGSLYRLGKFTLFT